MHPNLLQHVWLCADTWAPQFVVRDVPGKPGEREVAGVDWIFNSWGGKLGGCYDPWCALCRVSRICGCDQGYDHAACMQLPHLDVKRPRMCCPAVRLH